MAGLRTHFLLASSLRRWYLVLQRSRMSSKLIMTALAFRDVSKFSGVNTATDVQIKKCFQNVSSTV